MYEDEFERVHELRRRRRVGLLALVGFLFVAFAINGWRINPIWTVFENSEGTFAAGDPYREWIYAVCDGEEQQVTVLRDGQLQGAAGLDSLRTVRFPNWCDGLPTVDNPELADWQAQLSRLQALTASSGTAPPILDAAERMPLSVLYLKPLADWIGGDRAHALSFLDTVAERPMRLDHPNAAIARARREYFSDLVGSAVDTAARGEIAPERIERWLASSQIESSGPALQKLARAEGVDDDARAKMLERLGTLAREQRNDFYMALAPDLVHDGQYAALLDKQLGLLPREARFAAAQQLLTRSDASVEFSKALLSSLRRESGRPDAQLDLFMTIADKLRREADAPLLLAGRLKDIPGMQRRMAATYLLGLDEPGESAFALGVLGTFADLHPLSQPKVIYGLMQSPQFDDRSVQQACLLAIQLQIRGPARNELLAAMSRHQALESDLRSTITAELRDNGPPDRTGGF
jgi:hypothetical protein